MYILRELSYILIDIYIKCIVCNRGRSRISSKGAHLKKLCRAEGGAKIFGVFRVKNHDFTPKNLIFSIAEGGAKMFEVYRVKNHDFTPKNHFSSNFRGGRGGARRVRPPPPPP